MKIRCIPRVTNVCLIAILVLALLAYLAEAKDAGVTSPQQNEKNEANIEYKEMKKIPIPEILEVGQDCYATAYQANLSEDELTQSPSPARVCFRCRNLKQEESCFSATILPTKAHKTAYNCQFFRELSIAPILEKKEPHNGILFVAEYSGGGSGSLSHILLCVFDKQMNKFVNILPNIAISELGEYLILRGYGEPLDGTLVVADYIWGKDETHFSPHKFTIIVYQYNQHAKIFEQIGRYMTKRKYENSESDDRTEVIRQELNNVRKLIKCRG
jgi:hypothetical protein